MYLGRSEIRRRVGEEALIENCNPKNIQGAGVDLEIERLFRIVSGACLGREKRQLPEVEEVPGDIFTLEPRRYYLCSTREKINMPSDLIAFILPRSTLFRSGVSLRTAVVDPGYRGTLTLGIKNEADYGFSLEKKSRIAQIVFADVRGEVSDYKGRYQGGKVK